MPGSLRDFCMSDMLKTLASGGTVIGGACTHRSLDVLYARTFLTFRTRKDMGAHVTSLRLSLFGLHGAFRAACLMTPRAIALTVEKNAS